MRTSIEGERALVTGAGTGIGRAIAVRLAQLGCSVTLVGRRPAPLEETADLCRQEGAASTVAPCDLTDADAIASLAAGLGHLDILVNDAGVLVNKPLEETTTEELDAILMTNVRAPYLLCRETLPLLRASGRGEIVNICSVVAHAGYRGQSAYGASKHALLGMTKALANEVYEDGIRVHAISPGGVLTDMVAKARPDLEGVPMIVPDDIADAVEIGRAHV